MNSNLYKEAKNKFESLFVKTDGEDFDSGKINSKLLFDLDYAEINHTIKGRQKCDTK